MKYFYALLALVFSAAALATMPTRFENDVIFGGYAIPKTATGQALGASTFKWEAWLNSINGSSVGSFLSSSRAINTSAPLTGGGDLSADRTIAIPKATALVNGYLAAVDWFTFQLKANSTVTITPAAPLTGGGDLSSNRTISIPKASALVDGYLAAVDWLTFQYKANSTVTITPSAPLTGGGDLSTNRTISIPKASAIVDGYLAAVDWFTFQLKANSTVTLTASAPITGGGDLSANRSFGCTVATASVAGCLAAADFTTFNAKVSATRAINTSAPLTGGGDLSSDRTIAIPKATDTVDGYLAATDRVAFQLKANSTITITASAPLSGGGDLSANRTISLATGNLTSTTSGVTIGGTGKTVTSDITIDIAAATNLASGLVSIASQTFEGAKTFLAKAVFRAPGAAFQNNGGSVVTLQAPLNMSTAAYTFNLPPDMGTSTYVLQTDGVSITSWVAQSGGGGISSIGNIDANAASAKGLTLSGSAISAQSASALFPGLVNIVAQSWTGVKSFLSKPIFTAPGAAFQNNGGSTVTFQAPLNMSAASYTFNLPPNMGTNTYVLQTDGVSITSWVAAGSSSVSTDFCSLDTQGGWGSSNTTVRYYANGSCTGTSLTLTNNNSTNGAKITANTAGLYCANMLDNFGTGNTDFAVTVNSSSLSTNPGSGSFTASFLFGPTAYRAATANVHYTVNGCAHLNVNDFLTPQAQNTSNGSDSSFMKFTVYRVN